MMNDPCVPPSLVDPVVVLPALRIHLRLTRVRPPFPLLSPAPFHLDIPSPLAFLVLPSSNGLAPVGFARFLSFRQLARFISRLFFPPANRRDAICIRAAAAVAAVPAGCREQQQSAWCDSLRGKLLSAERKFY